MTVGGDDHNRAENFQMDKNHKTLNEGEQWRKTEKGKRKRKKEKGRES